MGSVLFLFFKKKTAYELRISDWSSDVCSSDLPAGYEGTATPEAHRACEVIQERIREHVVATNDMRLFGLLTLLGQASLRMEQALRPAESARMTRKVEEALISDERRVGQECDSTCSPRWSPVPPNKSTNDQSLKT